jgi:phage/plasmid-associated DNA primase
VWEWTGRRWTAVPDGEIRCRLAEFCKRPLAADSLQAEPRGVLNWAIAGLADLRREGRFVVPAGCAADLRALRLESNPTRRFLTERYQGGTGQVATASPQDLHVRSCQGACRSTGT